MNQKMFSIFSQGYYAGFIDGLAEGLENRPKEKKDLLIDMVNVAWMNREDYSIEEISKELDLPEMDVRGLISFSMQIADDNAKEMMKNCA